MAKPGDNEADEPVISFDLQTFFDEIVENIDIFNEQEVPDSELGALLDQVQGNLQDTVQNENAEPAVKPSEVPVQKKKM